MNSIQTIQQNLSEWYQKNKRDLPWRLGKNPYSIWISEVILQQTRVDQGTAYYHRFLERFPDVISLATADEDDVLKLWQGLGYYSRARNLHKAAQQVMNDHDGIFPSDYDAIRNLKGIGPYTAAAISSIAFGLPVATVDGNVARVIARLFAVEEPVNKGPGIRIINELADALMNPADPSEHNQAMMEFGALQCTPVSPSCDRCPLADVCEAREKGMVKELPRKVKTIKRRSRYFHYLIVLSQGKIAIQQRGEKDIWQGLYEFPLIETSSSELLSSAELERFGLTQEALMTSNEAKKHVLSHQDIFARFYHTEIHEPAAGLHFIDHSELANFALPRLIDRYLEQYDLKTGLKT